MLPQRKNYYPREKIITPDQQKIIPRSNNLPSGNVAHPPHPTIIIRLQMGSTNRPNFQIASFANLAPFCAKGCSKSLFEPQLNNKS